MGGGAKVNKAELEAELKRMTSRSDAHWQNYLEMLRRVDDLTVKLREAKTALEQIRDGNWKPTLATPSRDYWMQQIAREALE